MISLSPMCLLIRHVVSLDLSTAVVTDVTSCKATHAHITVMCWFLIQFVM